MSKHKEAKFRRALRDLFLAGWSLHEIKNILNTTYAWCEDALRDALRESR